MERIYVVVAMIVILNSEEVIKNWNKFIAFHTETNKYKIMEMRSIINLEIGQLADNLTTNELNHFTSIPLSLSHKIVENSILWMKDIHRYFVVFRVSNNEPFHLKLRR